MRGHEAELAVGNFSRCLKLELVYTTDFATHEKAPPNRVVELGAQVEL